MFVLLTPAHDEAGNIPELVRCVGKSSLKPDLWVLVDDQSTDDTATRFLAATQGFGEVCNPTTEGGYMGFRYSEVVRAGAAHAKEAIQRADFVGILDCDIRFGPEYWAQLAVALEQPSLGIVSGLLCSENENGEWQVEMGQRVDLPRGGLCLTKGDCFREIGGISRCRAPDSVMNAQALMKGWTLRLKPDLLAYSVRPTNSRGDRSGWDSRGQRAFNVGQPMSQTLFRAAAMAARGRGHSAMALMLGYGGEMFGGERVADSDVIQYYRWHRPREWLRSACARIAGGVDPHATIPARILPSPPGAGANRWPTSAGYREKAAIRNLTDATGLRDSLLKADWSSENRMRTLSRLAAHTTESLRAWLGGHRTVLHAMYPTHSNTGDHLIALGENEILRTLGVTARKVPTETRRIPRRYRRIPLVMRGGGYLGDPGKTHYRKVCRWIRRHEAPILFMPCSTFFRKVDPGPWREACASANVTLFARDLRSQEIGDRHLPGRVFLVPDSAFAAAGLVHAEKGSARVLFPRTDREILGCGLNRAYPGVPVREWLDPGVTPETVGASIQGKFHRVGWIATDRLHVHVAAKCLGLAHAFHPNYYHKNRSFYDTWSLADPLVTWVD
ncbi:polysaccharide pyruvyl transferase family protein [Planctomycetota bacterium]